jgi:MFS family permease
VLSSTAFVCFLGMVNVGELLLVREALGGSGTQYAIVVAVMGAGITVGTVLAGRVPRPPVRVYLAGLALCAGAMIVCALAPAYWVVVAAVAGLGVGNGVALVSENIFLQQVIPDEFRGRVFGIKNSLVSWAFAVAFVSAGALGSALGARALYGVAAAGCLLAWASARARLLSGENRRRWPIPHASTATPPSSVPTSPTPSAAAPQSI